MNEKIWFFNQLSHEEQTDVEQHVEKHPELMPLLEDAKVLGPLLHDNGSSYPDPLVDEALAYFITTKGASFHPVPLSLQWVFQRIEARLAADPELQARYQEIEQRLVALEAASDPVRQFERLSGRRLPQPMLDSDPSDSSAHVRTKKGAQVPRYSVSWPPMRRWAAGVVMVSFMCYGVLVLASLVTWSDLENLAVSAPPSYLAQTVTLRSETPETPEDQYEQDIARAMSLFQAAYSDTFGLFPQYDKAMLTEVARLLSGVLNEAEVPSIIFDEARYQLTRVYLAQGDDAAARVLLRRILLDGRFNVEQARTLLRDLEALSQ